MTERPASVLVVDDEPNILLSLQFLMKKAGYDVRTASDGEQALAEVEREKPNVVLLDVMMPKLDGFSVCQRIRANANWHDVRTASDGEQALAEVEREKPNVVLLDVMMPKLDGFSVCQRIRANANWHDVRVIMLTARGRDVEREKGLALGADDYITKPFSTRDAVDRVAAVLARPDAAPGGSDQA
jgi:DNA-binding response OmpR family regulator